MACCVHSSSGTGRVFSRVARRHRRRYLRRGLEKTQRQMVEGLRRAGTADASLLDIGCGVGFLHQHILMEAGVRHALGVDLSEQMLEEARSLAAANGLSERTEYRLGDFVEIADELAMADITILDKVVCCYPDAETLVARSLAKTRRVYALTYPRGHILNRIVAAVGTALLWLVRAQFRPYVHPPARLNGWITAQGFREVYHARTPIWCTKVYLHDAVTALR